MRGLARRALVILAVVGASFLLPAVASAHPLGNFTINTSAGIVVSPGSVRVEYVVDMAEIPTVQAMPSLDEDGDGVVTAAERSSWATDRAIEILAALEVRVDGQRLALVVASARAELLPGQGGLDVLRLEATFSADAGSSGELSFRDGTFEDRVGWHEVFASAEPGVALIGSSVPSASPSRGLRAYPDDLLSSPLDVREAAVTFAPGEGSPASPTSRGASTARPDVLGGAFADLVGRTGTLMLVALVLAFGFGAVHALGPGHGKALMAAYLVGAGGRARHAVAVGGAVALMHTASVLALGLVVLSATEVFAPERVYPMLGVTSGLVALGLGVALLVVRLGHRGDGHAGHDHPGGPRHAHQDHGHAGAAHPHPHAAPPDRVLSRRGLLALAVAGGVLPSPTALVVLLGSVALHRVAYGLALIGAFSLGLAAALVGVGLVALRARDIVATRLGGRFARLMPIASAAGIAVLGAVLTVNGVTRL